MTTIYRDYDAEALERQYMPRYTICSGLQTAAPKPANKGCFGLTFGANKQRLGLTITANKPTFWANSLQTAF